MPKKEKDRNEIRVLDIPTPLFNKIAKNAKKAKRSHGAEVLLFLEEAYK